MSDGTQLAFYDTAKAALESALRVDEVLDVRDTAERFRLYARQVRDRDMIANANEIHMRATRRLGQMLREAKGRGEFRHGGKLPQDPDERAKAEHSRVTLQDIGIDRKLSSLSQQVAELSDDVFEARVQSTRDRIVAAGAATVNPVRDLSTEDKKARRQERVEALGAKQQALPQKRYGVILADPEWEHVTWSEAGKDRAPANHYPVSSLEAIKARPVGDIAADDCVIFLWSTVPHLALAFDVLQAWGFTYKSSAVWRKVYPGQRQGTGFWFRINHEILLVGTRGTIPAPAPGTQFGSVIEAPVGRHSEKPMIVHDMIEALYGPLPKIELNARAARPGWDVWGNEAPERAEAAEADDVFAAMLPNVLAGNLVAADPQSCPAEKSPGGAP